MNYRQINTSREIRQWCNIFLKAASLAVGYVMMYNTNDDVKTFTDNICGKVKWKFNRFVNNL